jgi:hypothetical protein
VDAQGRVTASATSFGMATDGLECGGHGPQFRTHQFQTELNSALAPLLLVGGANGGPFSVSKEREIVGARDMALGVFPRTAHIHDRSIQLEKVFNR